MVVPSSTRHIVEAALRATRRGFVVIPFNSDKIPRVAWGFFNQTKPTESDVKAWASDGLFSHGFAYLTGEASRRLLILDFDDLGKAFEFEEKFQDLAKTYKVMTSRGFHYYYFAADDFAPTTQHIPGIDVLWGMPVIAPPTPNYNAQNNMTPRKLEASEWQAITRHFKINEEQTAPRRGAAEINPETILSWDAIVAMFRRDADAGRNKALFNALCIARDSGKTMSDCYTNGLFDAFMFAQAPLGHKTQSQTARRNEFKRTLASVYKRAPRILKDKELKGLSDDARQRLIMSGQIGTARVLDALLQVFAPSTVFSRREAIHAIGHIINHEIIDAALNAVFEGKLLFSKASPSPAPLPDNALEKAINKNAFYGRKKTGHYFFMPNAEKIQRLVGAEYYGSTPLKLEEIDSVKSYRAKLLKSKLDRERKRIYQGVLGRSLAVTERTVRNYLGIIGYESIPQYQFISTVSWENVNPIFEASDWNGSYFIQAHTGEKAPAVLGAALRFLKQKKAVMLMKQTASIYVPSGRKEIYHSDGFKADLQELMEAHASGKSANIRKDEKPLHPDAAKRSLDMELKIKEYWAVINAPKIELEAQKQAREQALDEATKWEAIRLTRAKIREVREDAAALCLMMPSKSLSHDNAARLLIQFGQEKVFQTAVKTIMDWGFAKNSKRPIKSPVGLLIKRLKRGGQKLAEMPPTPANTPLLTHTPTAKNEGVNKGVWDRRETLY